jgi:hypothetical protein
MNNSIRTELLNHILDCINEEMLTNDNADEWHYYAFNEDYYIIGYWHAAEWLKKHDLDAFEAIAEVVYYRENAFGDSNIDSNDINPEWVVNQLAYFYGEELIAEFVDCETIEDLQDFINEELEG